MLRAPFNQNHYVFAYILLSFLIVGFTLMFNIDPSVTWLSYMQIWGIKALNGGMFLGSGFFTIYFLRGTNYDVLKEIFDENNTAAGVFVGLYLIALAIVLTINS